MLDGRCEVNVVVNVKCVPRLGVRWWCVFFLCFVYDCGMLEVLEVLAVLCRVIPFWDPIWVPFLDPIWPRPRVPGVM